MKLEERAPRSALTMPLEALVRLGEQRLVEAEVLAQAGRSALYEGLWRGARLRVRPVRRREELRELPFTCAADLLENQRRGRLRRLACSSVCAWFATSGGNAPPPQPSPAAAGEGARPSSLAAAGEGRKWIPFSKRDIQQVMGLLMRLAHVAEVREADIVLAVPPMSPRVSNSLPYLWMYADILESKQKLEFIVASTYMLGNSDWPSFAVRRQPAVLFCRPGDAVRLAGHLAEAAGAAEGRQGGQQPDGRPAGPPLPSLRTGIFFGEPLAPHRERLREKYGLEPFDCYLSAEFPGLFAECSAHAGLHVWLDVCIAELIPTHQRQAVFLDQAAAGLEGELVLTTFGEALPLIRYRTGDLVRVVDTAPCACGITHPRVAVLGKVGEASRPGEEDQA